MLSIDGIGAFELISRKSTLEALMTVEGGPHICESDDGTVHQIEQGEGGERGDPLMPLLFAMGQHASLCAIDEELAEGERLMAFLDDVYISTNPEGLQHAYARVERELWRHSRIRVHEGKTQVWNSGGERPEFCDVLERVAQVERIRAADDRAGHSGVGDTIGARGSRGNEVARSSRGPPSVVEPNPRSAGSGSSVGSPPPLCSGDMDMFVQVSWHKH